VLKLLLSQEQEKIMNKNATFLDFVGVFADGEPSIRKNIIARTLPWMR